ncbi:MAG: voltage-gated potassium channel [Paraglaciecola sp.]|jgi:voltage-gated potassium channel
MNIKGIRQRLAVLLEPKADQSFMGKLIDRSLIGLIFLNVVAVIASTVPELDSQYGLEFEAFNIFSVMVFSIEYLLRIWSCVELHVNTSSATQKRLAYVLSPMALIDLLVILPFYLGLFFTVDLRILRVLRLLRIFKLGRYSSAMAMLIQAFRQEYKVLLASFSILLIMMVLAASGIYLIEHAIQPDKFGSIPAAMWWATTTLTTVGYGDVTPITPLGKFFGGAITLLGMGMVALPAGILASSFSEQAHQRRETFRLKVKEALADGKLSSQEYTYLEQLRESLDIEKEQAELVFNLMDKQHSKPAANHCPHCGKAI